MGESQGLKQASWKSSAHYQEPPQVWSDFFTTQFLLGYHFKAWFYFRLTSKASWREEIARFASDFQSLKEGRKEKKMKLCWLCFLVSHPTSHYCFLKAQSQFFPHIRKVSWCARLEMTWKLGIICWNYHCTSLAASESDKKTLCPPLAVRCVMRPAFHVWLERVGGVLSNFPKKNTSKKCHPIPSHAIMHISTLRNLFLTFDTVMNRPTYSV